MPAVVAGNAVHVTRNVVDVAGNVSYSSQLSLETAEADAQVETKPTVPTFKFVSLGPNFRNFFLADNFIDFSTFFPRKIRFLQKKTVLTKILT
jgi:hypothetical protein